MLKMFTLFVVAGSAITGFLSGPALAQEVTEQGRYVYGHHMMDWGSGLYGMMIFGPLTVILVLAALIAVTVLLVRWAGGGWQTTPGLQQSAAGLTPLEILRERFARGEIDKKEFEDRRQVLEK